MTFRIKQLATLPFRAFTLWMAALRWRRGEVAHEAYREHPFACLLLFVPVLGMQVFWGIGRYEEARLLAARKLERRKQRIQEVKDAEKEQ